MVGFQLIVMSSYAKNSVDFAKIAENFYKFTQYTHFCLQGWYKTWTLDSWTGPWTGLWTGSWTENRVDLRDMTIAKAILTLFFGCLKYLRALCGREGDKNQAPS